MTSSLRPPSTLLIGPGGTGKTTAVVSLLTAGLKVRMLATEASAPNRVLEECRKRNIPATNFDWCFVSPSMPKWESLIESAKIVNSQDLKMISEMKGGIAKQDGGQWIKMLQGIANFKSEKDGRELGDATEWGSDCAFVIDGLTGMSTMSRNLTVGLKPNPSPGEWGVMQANLLNVLNKLISDCKCYFVLIAHVERETNELTGGTNITVSTLGAKLAPKLPPLFTNVVLAKKQMDKFFWSTNEVGVDTKNGDLPLAGDLKPDFTPIVDGFKARCTAADGTQKVA